MRPPTFTPRPAFAAIAPGLEPVLAAELAELGVPCEVKPGGVAFTADLQSLVTVHRWSRCAGRVTVEIGRAKATSLEELARGVRNLPWKDFVHPFQPIEIKVVSSGAKLHFATTVSKKIEWAVKDALKGPRIPGGRAPREPAVILVRLEGEKATLSADASGELMHRRGWRLATAKAPLRENLGAAVLRLAGWTPDEPLVDPMCGSGTFPIEAAGIAMGHAPGKGRDYAFLRWPCVDRRAWDDAKATSPSPQGNAPILGADRDGGAVTATLDNAKRAGVLSRVRVEQSAFSALQAPPGPGLIVMNPPWGSRIGGEDPTGLYRHIGEIIRTRWAGWRVALLVPDAKLAHATQMNFILVTTFANGGVRVGVWAFEP